jgi:hypothetical protein
MGFILEGFFLNATESWKSQIRISKSQTNSNTQCSNDPNIHRKADGWFCLNHLNLDHLILFRIWYFDIRIYIANVIGTAVYLRPGPEATILNTQKLKAPEQEVASKRLAIGHAMAVYSKSAINPIR